MNMKRVDIDQSKAEPRGEHDRRTLLSGFFLDQLFRVEPGRGWVVTNELSIFNSRNGFVVVAGQPGNDSDEAFVIARPVTRGQIEDLVYFLGLPIAVNCQA